MFRLSMLNILIMQYPISITAVYEEINHSLHSNPQINRLKLGETKINSVHKTA